MTRHFLDMTEITKEEGMELIKLASELKYKDRKELLDYCKGYRAVILFEKPSTRTRVSLEAAIASLGAFPIVLSANETQLSRGEEIKDTARVLSLYCDAIAARVIKHDFLEEMAKHSNVPVINALSDKYHPLQALADVMTLYERFKSYDFTLAYVGDGNNVCNSLIIASSIFGFKIRVSTPRGYEPSEEAVQKAEKIQSGLYEWKEDPRDAVKGADAIYTDTWISMGDESEEQVRLRAFKEWQVNLDLMNFASKDAVFMHCLPAHKGQEVTEEVFESSNSIVFDQAENRLHTAAAFFFYIWREVRL